MIGAARAQGADVEVPNLAQSKAEFDTWLMSDPDDINIGGMLIRRALGLKEE